jgi:hypothetical protein
MRTAQLHELPEGYQQHLSNLLDWLLEEVLSAGGDGDAALVLRTVDISAMNSLANTMMQDDQYWEIGDIKDGKYFTIYRGQEFLLITNDSTLVPSWSQCTVTL